MCWFNINVALTCLLGMTVVAVQSVVFNGTPIVLSAEEISAATKEFGILVKRSAESGPTSTTQPAVSTVEVNKLKEWNLSAVGAFHATMDAITAKNLLKAVQKPLIVIMVGVGATGGVGLSAVALYLKNGFNVKVIVLPRYKTDVINDELADAMWQKHLVAIETNTAYTGQLTINDLRRLPASFAATTAIRFFRIAVSGKCDGDTIAKREDELTKLLMAEAEAVRVLLEVLDQTITLSKTVVIESYVGAGYQHPDEVDNKFVLRYQLGETVGRWLNGLKSKRVFIGSYDLPCNTSTERGYFSVSKDGQKKLTMISNSYIPDFMVFITYPRESLLALEGAGRSNKVQYQFHNCSLIYLTPFVDPVNMKVSMSDCMLAAVRTRRKELRYDEEEVKAFFEALRKAEAAFGSAEGFLKLTVPDRVVKTVSRTAGIFRPIGTPNSVFRGDTYVTKVSGELKFEKEAFINFDHYAQLFAEKGNRLSPKQR